MKTLPALLAASSLLLTGCAAVAPNCTGTSTYTANPSSATLDHMAAPPANQQQFFAEAVTTYPEGCHVPVPAVIPAPFYTTWTSSDPVNAPIDSTFGPTTDGVATCKGPTTVPVTLTAVSVGNATATLICK